MGTKGDVPRRDKRDIELEGGGILREDKADITEESAVHPLMLEGRTTDSSSGSTRIPRV